MAEPVPTSAVRAGRARRIAFKVVVVMATLFTLVALLFAYPLIVSNWLPVDLWLAVRTDAAHPDVTAADAVHRLHSLALGVLAWGVLLGILLQAHRPKRKVAPLLAALAVPIAIAVSETMAGTITVGGTAPFLVVILIVVVLHPAVRDMLRLPGWDLRMLGLAAAAAVPWVVYAARIATAARDLAPGFEVDHLEFTSAVALLAILWGVIGASDHTGWRYAAAASVVAAASIALQSVLFPDVLSGLSIPWAVAALVWSAAYGGAAVLRARGSHGPTDSLLGSGGKGQEEDGAATTQPRSDS